MFIQSLQVPIDSGKDATTEALRAERCAANSLWRAMGPAAPTGHWDPHPDDVEEIARHCGLIDPALGALLKKGLLSAQGGSKRSPDCGPPTRTPRVELDPDLSNGGQPVIHNYGHGGSGFTLFWECAQQVLDILNAALGQKPVQ